MPSIQAPDLSYFPSLNFLPMLLRMGKAGGSKGKRTPTLPSPLTEFFPAGFSKASDNPHGPIPDKMAVVPSSPDQTSPCTWALLDAKLKYKWTYPAKLMAIHDGKILQTDTDSGNALLSALGLQPLCDQLPPCTPQDS